MIIQCSAAEYADEKKVGTLLNTSTKLKTPTNNGLSRENVFRFIPELLSSEQKLHSTEESPDNGIVTALSLMQQNIDALLFDNESGQYNISSKVLGDFDRLLNLNIPDTRGHADEETIEVVRMMFDIIFEDSNLPDKAKILFAKLQVPILKVAVLDRTFFSENSHPADQLINKLADTARLLINTDGKNSAAFYREFDKIVKCITHDFMEDTRIFSSILASSRIFHKEKQQKMNSSIQHLKKSTKQLKQLSNKVQTTKSVKMAISNSIKNKIIKEEISKEVREFLTTTWANVASVTFDKHGNKSHQWKMIMQVIDELVWVSKQQYSEQEKRNLTNTIPRLITNIQNGLESTHCICNKKARIFSTLLATHAMSLKEQRMARLDQIPAPAPAHA